MIDSPSIADFDLSRGPRPIAIEIASAARFSDLRAEWSDLLTRAAEPNVFMDPAMISAAMSAMPVHVLLAWQPSAGCGKERLVGVWAFGIGRPRKSPLPMRVLIAPAHHYAYLATPVIDRACIDDALDAMLDAVADDPRLPKIAALEAMGTQGATMDALARVLTGRDSAPRILRHVQRPKLGSNLDVKAYLETSLSGSSRKKLRQHRRRLAEQGSLESAIASKPADVRRALEEILIVEASGWKGRQGTAMLCNDHEAAFMRSAVGALADLGCASIHSLYLDGRPVSMQIIVRAGPTAFTWKTAYDEQFQDFSPGMLLLEDYTAWLLADASIAFTDSCAHDDSGFMAAWTERQPIADLWIDARRGGSPAFRLLGGMQKHYGHLREVAKAAHSSWRWLRAR